MTLPLTAAAVGAILLVFQQFLTLTVGLHRASTGIGVGIGGDDDLERKVRRQGNFIENAPIFIVILALTEMVGAPQMVVLSFGTAFVVARIFHAMAFSNRAGSHGGERGTIYRVYRVVGAFGTILSSLGLGGYLLYMLASGTI